MKKITEVYALKKGETYWICVGDKDNTPSQQELESLMDSLRVYKNFTFIVAPFNVKPLMIKKKRVAFNEPKEGEKDK